MKNPQVIFLIVIVAAALIFGGYLLAPSNSSSTSAKATATAAAANNDPALINNGDSPKIGKADAKEQIVVFSDFLCPYCKQAHTVINDVLKAYPNDTSVVYRNFIVHAQSKVLAEAAGAAQIQGKYKEMADELFLGDSIDTSSDDAVVALAKKIGLDINKFKSDLHSEKVDKQIDKDNADAQAMNLGGTPSIFLNNTSVDNFNNLQSLVKSQLGK